MDFEEEVEARQEYSKVKVRHNKFQLNIFNGDDQKIVNRTSTIIDSTDATFTLSENLRPTNFPND